jgi:hypothetical protein
LIVVDVVQLVLGGAEQKNRSLLRPECEEHPTAASLPLSLPGNPLLDEAATEIGVHQAALGPRAMASHRLASAIRSNYNFNAPLAAAAMRPTGWSWPVSTCIFDIAAATGVVV